MRGSASHRFAITLVRCGAVLVAGPPFYLAIAIGLLDRISPQQNYVDACLSVGAFIVGLALIISGVWIFQKNNAAVVIDDEFKFIAQEGWTFKDTAEQIASARIIEFRNFTIEQLQAPVKAKELFCVTEINALRMLGMLVAEPNFPNYVVQEHEGKWIVTRE